MPGLRLHVSEARALWGIGDADEVLAGRTLYLAARVAGITFQRLIAMGTIEFEFVRAHGLRVAGSNSL